MNNTFYFDTYALVEVYKSSPNYSKYTKDIKIMLNNLNLLEYAYFLKRNGRVEEEIIEIFRKLSRFNVDYDENDLLDAAFMKLKHLRDRLSFIDCIGYILAKRNNVKFLTGDENFRNMDNVEFVK